MSTIQRLTLIGLFNYDSSLFDGLELPSGYDKTTFIDSLLLEHGEKCVLYSNPDFMKYSIGAWGRKWSLELSRIYDALTAEYNPIYNYDRYEYYKDTDNIDHTLTNKPDYTNTQENDYDVTTETLTNSTRENETITNATKENETITNATRENETITDATRENETINDEITEHQISADNSSSYEPSSKDIHDGGKTKETYNAGKTKETYDAGKTKETYNGGKTKETYNGGKTLTANDGKITNTIKGTSQDIDEDTDREFIHDAHLYGNIGVTTSAAMVNEVVQQRFKYNLYGTAARLFANELLIGIY